MNIGIVGHAAEKFPPWCRDDVKFFIRGLLAAYGSTLISGACHMGGVDVWSEEIALELKRKAIIHKPAVLNWSGRGGYRDRNLMIARYSDVIHVIVVKKLHPEFSSGITFSLCYHCGTSVSPHVKSGACWTARQAMKMGKTAIWHIYDVTDRTWNHSFKSGVASMTV